MMPATRKAWPSPMAEHSLATWLLAALLLLAAPLIAVAEPTFPALTGRIVDEAGLLSPEQRAAIESQLVDLEQKSTDQLAVVTLNSLQDYPIEDYGYQLGRKWGIGQKGKDNGVLLIVAPNERKVRIEVGRGLEPQLTDAMSKLIIENAIIPQFRRGDYAAGIAAGVRDIKDVVLGDAEEVKKRSLKASDELDFWQLVLILFWIGVVLFVLFAVVQSVNQQAQQAAAGRGPQRRRGPVFYPVDYGGWGSGGGWGGGGGGGWSGGGGDFGGGGSSGSW